MTKMAFWENPTLKSSMFPSQSCTSSRSTSSRRISLARRSSRTLRTCHVMKATPMSAPLTRQVSARVNCSPQAITLIIFKWLIWLLERSLRSGSGAELRCSANSTIEVSWQCKKKTNHLWTAKKDNTNIFRKYFDHYLRDTFEFVDWNLNIS